MRRVYTLVFALLLVFSLLPMTAFAEEVDLAKSLKFGSR